MYRHWNRFIVVGLVGIVSLNLSSIAYADNPRLPHFDPTNPIVLNEYAVQKARAGDIPTAIILLKRALRITPDDARIRRNLEILRALQTGKPVMQTTPVAPSPEHDTAVQANVATGDGLPDVPLWPSK